MPGRWCRRGRLSLQAALSIGVPGKVVRPVSAEQAAGIKANEEEYLQLAEAHKKVRNL